MDCKYKKEVSHLRCRAANEFLNVLELMGMEGRKKDSLLPFLATENLDRKKSSYYESFAS